MKHFLILAALFTAETAVADSIIAGNKQTKTIACAKDGVVLIAGNDNTIKLTGRCKLVQVPGNHNKITGNKNSVTWSKTIDGDKAPEVSELGTGNKVTKKL